MEYINYIFIFNIKYKKNSIYNVKFTFIEIFIIGIIIIIIRKVIKLYFGRPSSGKYTNLSLNKNIINYIYRIYKNRFTIQRYNPSDPTNFNALNLHYNNLYILLIGVFDRFNIKEIQLERREDYEYFNLFKAENKNFIIINNK